jgi:hypothetical protein
MNKRLLFYDISELGWVRYLSAHLNYLKKKDVSVSICTNPSRKVFYRGVVDEILPVPIEYYDTFGHLQPDGNCLYDVEKDIIISNHDVISRPFQETYKEYTVVKEYSTFYGQRLFQPYQHLLETEKVCQKFRDVIIVFPRYRESKFSIRNIEKKHWIHVLNVLCEKYKEYDILSIGGVNGTFDISLPYKNYYNLIHDDDVLEKLICLCNMGKVISTLGTESGISLVATICKSNSYIIGQDKERILHENFCDARITCHVVKESPRGYIIKDFNTIVEEFIRFTNLMIFLKNNKHL